MAVTDAVAAVTVADTAAVEAAAVTAAAEIDAVAAAVTAASRPKILGSFKAKHNFSLFYSCNFLQFLIISLLIL